MPISPASRLVLMSVAIATLLTTMAGLSGSSDRQRVSSAAASAPAATNLAAPSPPSTATSAPSQAATAAPENSAPPPVGSPARTTEASELLADLITTLPVADEHRDGYSRDLFRLWVDDDGDGCNTRKEVLIAEAVVPPQTGSNCRITAGRWNSAYDGVEVAEASKLDIDHLVPLAEAWDSGAFAWSSDRREAYANDIGVPWALIAVTAHSNRSKGDRDPSEWMPPLASYMCPYLVDWVAVKVRWSLTVDEMEQQMLERLAPDCTEAPVPSIPVIGNSQ